MKNRSHKPSMKVRVLKNQEKLINQLIKFSRYRVEK